MNTRKLHLESDIDGEPDQTEYEIRFFLEEDGDSMLYETLNTDSPPLIPDEGDYISFEFVTEDETGEEVFRNKQGSVPAEEVATDGDYTTKYTGDLKVVSVRTSYEKCVTKKDCHKTKVSKTVSLKKP